MNKLKSILLAGVIMVSGGVMSKTVSFSEMLVSAEELNKQEVSVSGVGTYNLNILWLYSDQLSTSHIIVDVRQLPKEDRIKIADTCGNPVAVWLFITGRCEVEITGEARLLTTGGPGIIAKKMKWK